MASRRDRPSARDRARLTATKIAHAVEIERVTLTTVKPDISDADLQAALERTAITVAGRAAQDDAALMVALGRQAAGEAYRDEIGGVIYTSVLDKNRCDPCRDADDGVVRALDDPVRLARIPPNPDCKGRTRCRCEEFYVLKRARRGPSGRFVALPTYNLDFDPNQPRDAAGRWRQTAMIDPGALPLGQWVKVAPGVEIKRNQGQAMRYGTGESENAYEYRDQRGEQVINDVYDLQQKLRALTAWHYTRTLDFDPRQTRDRLGRWSKEGVHVGADVQRAADLLGQGVHVRLDQKREVSTLLTELAARVKEAKRLGDKAPTYDLCKVSVRDTNLFCAKSQGVARVKMPQLSGPPRPGSMADKLPKNASGYVDLSHEFRLHLKAQGIHIEDTTEDAGYLKATQNELNGAKVAGILRSMESGQRMPGDDDRLFVSADNYIVDGHHRWAAKVAHEIELGKPIEVKVAKIDLGIIELLAEANAFAEEWGIPQAAVGEGTVRLMAIEDAYLLARWDAAKHPRDPATGRFVVSKATIDYIARVGDKIGLTHSEQTHLHSVLSTRRRHKLEGQMITTTSRTETEVLHKVTTHAILDPETDKHNMGLRSIQRSTSTMLFHSHMETKRTERLNLRRRDLKSRPTDDFYNGSLLHDELRKQLTTDEIALLDTLADNPDELARVFAGERGSGFVDEAYVELRDQIDKMYDKVKLPGDSRVTMYEGPGGEANSRVWDFLDAEGVGVREDLIGHGYSFGDRPLIASTRVAEQEAMRVRSGSRSGLLIHFNIPADVRALLPLPYSPGSRKGQQGSDVAIRPGIRTRVVSIKRDGVNVIVEVQVERGA